MPSLLRRWDCSDDDDCNHAFKSSVTMIIVIVVVILVVKISLIVAICTFIKRRRSRALRPYQGGGYQNGAANQAYNAGYGGGAEWTGAQVPNYGAQQEPPPPGYYEMDRSAPEVKGGDGGGHGESGVHGDGGSHGASHGASHGGSHA